MTTTGTDPAPIIESPTQEQQAGSTTTSPLADAFAQFGALWAEAIRQIHENSTALFKHDDAMLTWAIGLMGAGVFYANTLLADSPHWLRFFALAPWIVGILASLPGRVVGSRVLQNTSGWYLKELVAFRGDAIALKKADIVATAMSMIRPGIRLVSDFHEQQAGSYWWWTRLSLAAHILAGTGFLAVVAVSFFPDNVAALVLVAL